MVSVVCEVLRREIEPLAWLERTAGLATTITKEEFSVMKKAGESAVPYSQNIVGVENCEDDKFWKYLMPDASLKGLVFFTDEGGAQFLDFGGTKKQVSIFTFNVRLYVWLNASRLATDGNGWKLSALASQQIAAALAKLSSHRTINIGQSDVDQSFGGVMVKKITELPKSVEHWKRWSFSKRGGLFVSPYDHTVFQISGEFSTKNLCSPDLTFSNNQDCLPI